MISPFLRRRTPETVVKQTIGAKKKKRKRKVKTSKEDEKWMTYIALAVFPLPVTRLGSRGHQDQQVIVYY